MIFQHPLIPLIFCVLTIILIIKESFVKHRFLKIKLLIVTLLTFASSMVFVFYEDIKIMESSYLFEYALVGIDLVCGILLFNSINSTLCDKKLDQLLTKSLDETKLFVVLDKKDRIKSISSRFLKLLNAQLDDVYKLNFFECLSNYYGIIGFNGNEATLEDILEYYENINSRANEGVIEIQLQEDNLKSNIIYFSQTVVSNNEKYKGRILVGELKNESELLEIEKKLDSTSSQLDIIRQRFVTILSKTNDGIFFNNLNDMSIWINDLLVSKLSLNGNSLSSSEFYENVLPNDLTLYKEKVQGLKEGQEYDITYRFKTVSGNVYVKEEGKKIVSNGNVELCGTMRILDDNSYQKTDTALDMVKTESELLYNFNKLLELGKVFEVIHFRLSSIPQINNDYGRAIGNMVMSEYISLIKKHFINDNHIYRISGLEFIGFITEYRKMDMLKNGLRDNEKLLNLKATLNKDMQINAKVHMGISMSNDSMNAKDTMRNAKEALRFCTNEKFSSNYAFYKDIK